MKDAAIAENVVAPCYPSGVQVQTFVNMGLFSASAFSALNWPADEAGAPIYESAPGKEQPDNAAVWESWKTTQDVFLPDGRKPEWTSRKRYLPAACREIDVTAAQARIPEWQRQKVPTALPPRFLSTYLLPDGNAVVDRNHEPIRVEVAMNRTVFDYITENELYDKDGQDKFLENGAGVDFPAPTLAENERGSHWIKAAWKVLGGSDDFDSFHKSWAYVSPIFRDGTVLDECQLVVVGLVALHIISKFSQAKQWAWSTFEHELIAPCPACGDAGQRGQVPNGSNDFLFFSPHCRTPDCTSENTAPALYPQGSSRPQASQLVREREYGAGEPWERADRTDTEALNQELAEGLKGSVWQHYRLKGTQWYDKRKSAARPPVLANTVLEAYDQTTSCIGCHSHATLTTLPADIDAAPSGPRSDLVFSLAKARHILLVE